MSMKNKSRKLRIIAFIFLYYCIICIAISLRRAVFPDLEFPSLLFFSSSLPFVAIATFAGIFLYFQLGLAVTEPKGDEFDKNMENMK